MLNRLLDGQEKQTTIDCDQSLGNRKVNEKEGEGVGKAPPSRYDYGILLGFDPSRTMSRKSSGKFPEHTAADQSKRLMV